MPGGGEALTTAVREPAIYLIQHILSRTVDARSTCADAGVGSRLICTVNPPRFLVSCTRPASGWTSADVPTVKKRSQEVAARLYSMINGSIASPNHTTPGRASPPQCGHRGGSSGNGTASSHHWGDDASQRRQHWSFQMDPWNLTTSRVRARLWRPSTFCVMHANVSNRRLQSIP